MPRIRLARFLAEAGVASRRKAESLIREGRITVNNHTVKKVPTFIDPEKDVVMFDGCRVKPEKRVYLLLNKPKGVLCTTVKNERSVMRFVAMFAQRLFPVGRLDKDSEGLLILTNDGELSYRLTHPRFGVEKEYLVFVKPRTDKAVLKEAEEKGAWSSDGKLKVKKIRLLRHQSDGSWLRVVSVSGKKRLVRRLLAKYGYKVKRLVRVRIGPIIMDENLLPGRWRYIRVAELSELRRLVGLEEEGSAASKDSDR